MYQTASLEQHVDAVTYHIGDYAFIETSSEPQSPYQIRRIEEFVKLTDGSIEARVVCYYRRRDLPHNLLTLADRNAASCEHNMLLDGNDSAKNSRLTEFRHREVFLSRHMESVPTRCIRGKCSVRLLIDVENMDSYLNEPTTFYYICIYDQQQKTLLPDHASIRIGSNYQAVIPSKAVRGNDRDCDDLEVLVWSPDNQLTNEEIDQFELIAKSVGTFARALDQSSSITQPSLHMTAAAACRDTTQLYAMNVLHSSNYNLAKAITLLVPSTGPALCMDEMEHWSIDEARRFEEGLRKYGKEFRDIQQEFLPWKAIKSMVEYYYMWKTSDRYLEQKRLKALSRQDNVKQITITPRDLRSGNVVASLKGTSAVIGNTSDSNLLTSQTQLQNCTNCTSTTSKSWHTWSSIGSNHKLCSNCWWYWKKFGHFRVVSNSKETVASKGVSDVIVTSASSVSSTSGSTTVANMSTRSVLTSESRECYRCRDCGKICFTSDEFTAHQIHHRPFKCTMATCLRDFKTKYHLNRHLSNVHGAAVAINKHTRRLRTKSDFLMRSTLSTKIARKLCKRLHRIRHIARKPTDVINISAIKSSYLKIGSIPYQKLITPVKKRPSLQEISHKLKQSKESNLNDIQTKDVIVQAESKISIEANTNESEANKITVAEHTVNGDSILVKEAFVEKDNGREKSTEKIIAPFTKQQLSVSLHDTKVIKKHSSDDSRRKNQVKSSQLPAAVKAMKYIMDKARKSTPRRPRNRQFMISLEDYYLHATPYLKRLRRKFARQCRRKSCRKPFKEIKFVLK